MKKPELSHLVLGCKAWSKRQLARVGQRSSIILLTVSAMTNSNAAIVDWEGSNPPTPGDGLFWSDPLNWQGDALPLAGDTVTFGAPGTGGSTIHLDSNRTIAALEVDENTSIGAIGTSLTLTNTSGTINVASGITGTMNARLAGTANYTLSGGGTLFMTNQLAQVLGNWTVNGNGTTLMVAYTGSPSPVSRGDALVLGSGTTRTITLTNGGVFKVVGSGYNPDGSTKNFVIGAGGGGINVAAGFQQMTIDDGSQISALAGAGAFTKSGNGALLITSQDYNLATSAVNVNGGVLRLARVQGNTAASRYSAFAASAPFTINNGGTLVLDGGTLGIFDNATTLNPGGIISVIANDHELGVRTGTATTLTLNGGTILAREGFNPQSSVRFPRINSQILGIGTVDVVGGTANAGSQRLVLQRGDAGSTFNGTWVIHGNTWLEQNPRHGAVLNTGNTLGTGATVDLRGHNAGLDMRDNSSGSNTNMSAYAGNTLSLSGEAGSIGRALVNHNTANTGNIFQFGHFRSGNNRFYLTNANSYGLRFSSSNTLTGAGPAMPLLEINATSGKLEFNAAFNEHVAGDGLRFQGRAGTFDLSGTVNLSTLNFMGRETRIFGVNGAIGLGSISGSSVVNISSGLYAIGGTSGSGGTILHLHNNLANTGGSVAAANNTNRIDDSALINMLGDSVLRLTSLNNTAASETVGTVNVVGNPTFDAVQTGTAGAGTALTIGNLVTGATSAVNFSGTTLGTTAGSGKIFITTPAFSGFMGSQYTAGNEWAKYGVNGVTAFVAGDYNTNPTGAWSGHVKLTAANTLSANQTANTLNLQMPGGAALALGANNLTLNAGGIHANTNSAQGITGTTGVVTTGTGTQVLQVHTPAALDLNAIVADNSNGAVTLVKNGANTLRLTNQGHGIGAGNGTVGSIIPATHTNTFSGGLVINNGRLVAWRPEYLGTGDITIQGGALDLDIPVAAATYLPSGLLNSAGGNNSVINVGRNVIFNASGGLYADDNGEGNDASVGGNATLSMGSLTVNGGHIIGFGAYANAQRSAAPSGNSAEDFLFQGATFSGTPTFNAGVTRSGGSHLVIGGALTGSAFNLEALGDAAGTLQLGAGGLDNTPNTYTGTITLTRTSGNIEPTLRLNKANGTTAVTGDIIINGGTLAWGTGATGTENTNITIQGSIGFGGTNTYSPNDPVANQWTGNSIATAFANTTSGNHQIADTANITLMLGTVNEGARLVHERFNNFRQLNGNFNTGFGNIQVNTYEISGGSYTHNSGGTFTANTMNLLSGAPDITVGNNFAGTVSRLEVGPGGLNINGQNLVLGNGDYFTPSAGAVLQLSGNVTVMGDPLNMTRTDRHRGIISGLGGREWAMNWVDLNGGNRTISVDDNIFYTINTLIRNGGIVKEGDGTLAIQNQRANTFSGGVTVNNGILLGRSGSAAGAGGAITVNSGGTVKMDGGWTWSNPVNLSGPGADIPQSGGQLEDGALVSAMGYNRLTGPIAVTGGATIASSMAQVPNTSRLDSAGGVGPASNLMRSHLSVEDSNGITGTGNLTLSGAGDGTITGGVNVSGGLIKSGSGTWTIGGASTYAGQTLLQAGTLNISHSAALGSPLANTVVYGGATLGLSGNISTSEPLVLHGSGWEGVRGAVRNISGFNNILANVHLATSTVLRSDSGHLNVGDVTGVSTAAPGASLTLTGAGDGNVVSGLTLNVPGGDALIKAGTGSWALTDPFNTSLTGAIRIDGGNLLVVSGYDTTQPLRMNGGNLYNLLANGSVNGVQLLSGGGTISTLPTFELNTISRLPGATANFLGPLQANGTPNINGIIGGWATNDSLGGPEFAKTRIVGTATLLEPLTGTDYTLIPAPPTAGAAPTISDTNNTSYDVDINGFASPVTGALSTNSLRVVSGMNGLQAGASAITLGSGGLLVQYSGERFNIGGSGLLSGPNPNSELIIHAYGDTSISNPIIGAGTGGLTKAGDGDLRLFGSSSFTGPININGGSLSIIGQVGHPGQLGGSLTNANRLITLNNGTFSVHSGDYDLNDYDTVTPGAQSMQFMIAPAGGTLHSGNGNLLINDTAQLGGTGQLMGSGDLRITGGGRVSINANFPLFTGDITVAGGVLSLQNGVATGPGTGGAQVESQRITLLPNTALMLGSDLAQSVELHDNTQVTVFGADRAIRGPVHINGTVNLVMQERDAVGTARSLGFHGPVTGSGTLNISGTNTNGRVQFGGGSSTFSGTVNVGTNSTIEIRAPGSLGNSITQPTVNLVGESRSRLLLRNYQSGDYHLNVNVTGRFAEIYAGRLDNFGSTWNSQGAFTINNLSITGNNVLTLAGDNSNWVTVNNPVTASDNTVINTTSNANFLQGGSFGGLLDKRGPNILALEGATTVSGKTIIRQGWIDLRGGGTLSTTGIDIHGGNLMISNNVAEGSNPNRIAGVPINLGGGSLRVVGTTNLGTLTPVPGTTELNYAMDTQSGISPLIINDMGATRQVGSQIRLASTYGTIGAPTSNQTFPRIWVGATGTGIPDTFGTGLAGSVDIIPWMVFNNNEFVAYRHTLDSGVPLGYVQVTNGSMRTDAADGTAANQLRSATAPNEIMRFTGTTTTTLGGSATWRAIKMDGGATRTIDVGTANTLTVERGAIIHVGSGNNLINNGTIRPGAGVSEFHFTTNLTTNPAVELQIGSVIANNGTALSLVKNGTGTLRLQSAAANTFTGNVHLNNGLLINNHVNHLPSTATIFFNGGRWEPNHTDTGTNVNINAGNNIVVNSTAAGLGGNPALSLDNGTGGQDNNYQFGSVTINNGAEWSLAGWDGTDADFNATNSNPHVFNGTPTLQLFQGRTGAGTNEAVMTFRGPITGTGFYVYSTGIVAGSNPSNTTLNIGAGDTLPNTYTGDFTMLGTGVGASMPIVRLNKAPGTTALTGNVNINGGQLISLASEQIADTANIVMNGDPTGSNQMGWALNGQTESVNNVTINGGGINTSAGTLNVGGNLTVNMGSQTDNLQINSLGGRVNVTGSTTINDFGRVVIGADNAQMDLMGTLSMTGGVIQQNSGIGVNILRLRGDVTATSSQSIAARIANSDDIDTFVEFHGLRTFTVNDGPQGNDLVVSGVIRNSTATGAPPTSGLYKTGTGTMVLAGTGAANTYTGDTTVSQGALHLAKTTGQNAFASASVFIGDGNGPSSLVLRNSHQIPNTTDIAIDSHGVLDFASFNASESIRNLSGASGATTLLGPSSALTVNITTNTTYDGSILGGGAVSAVTKTGSAKWTLSGASEYAGDTLVNAGTLEVNGSLNGSTTRVASGATLQGIGTVSDVVVSSGGTLAPGTSPGVLATRNVGLLTGSTTNIEIGGINPGNGAGFHDQVVSFGSISLDGTLNVSLLGGYVPNKGDKFLIWTNDLSDAIAGIFAGLPEGATFGVPETVSTFDYWQISYVENSMPGSDGNDISLLYIPEPSSAALAALGSLLLLSRRRRRP